MGKAISCDGPGCSSTFVRRSPAQRYCSAGCRARGVPCRRSKPATYGESRTCPECESAFVTTGPRQFYCSPYCKSQPGRRRRQAERDASYPTRVCGWCADTLTNLSQQARYCSDRCRYARRYAANRDRKIAAAKTYAARPDVAAIQSARRHRRRALRRNAVVVPFTSEQMLQRLGMFRGCWICHSPAQTVDHVKPLSKGGPHMLANLRPACLSCNSRKHATWRGARAALRDVERIARTKHLIVGSVGECGGAGSGRMARTARAG